MELYNSSRDYLFNLEATSSSVAKKLWRQSIKEKWNHECCYCGSIENLTLDHVVPQSKGGSDTTKNVVCCCHHCNHSKGHTPWENWYESQDFFTEERRGAIIDWMRPDKPKDLYVYSRTRPNGAL
jgi:hypothetical protein